MELVPEQPELQSETLSHKDQKINKKKEKEKKNLGNCQVFWRIDITFGLSVFGKLELK